MKITENNSQTLEAFQRHKNQEILPFEKSWSYLFWLLHVKCYQKGNKSICYWVGTFGFKLNPVQNLRFRELIRWLRWMTVILSKRLREEVKGIRKNTLSKSRFNIFSDKQQRQKIKLFTSRLYWRTCNTIWIEFY